MNTTKHKSKKTQAKAATKSKHRSKNKKQKQRESREALQSATGLLCRAQSGQERTSAAQIKSEKQEAKADSKK